MKQAVVFFAAILCLADAAILSLDTAREAPFFIRALIKDGFASNNDSQCSDSDKDLIKDALKEDALKSYPTLASKYDYSAYDTTSFSGDLLHRSLTTNCAEVCCSFDWGYCYHDYPECYPHPVPSDNCDDDDFSWNRKLTIIREEVVGYDGDTGDHTRTVTISEGDALILQMCEERKTQMIHTIWREHGEVSAACGNFLDFSVTLQCILK